jgi:hypothetical protein
MRARLLVGILVISTSFSVAQTPAKLEGMNASSAETVIAASLASMHIDNYSKVQGAQEWVSDFQEFNSHLVERYHARYDFRLDGNVLWVSMRDLEEWGASGWEKPLIPAKGSEQKLIAQMVDHLSSVRKTLPASPPVVTTNSSAVAPHPGPSNEVREQSLPGDSSIPQPPSRAAADPPPTPEPRKSAAAPRAPAQSPTIVGISLGMPYAAASKIGAGLYPGTNITGLTFNAGPIFRGEAWVGGSSGATAVSATDGGRVDFVARVKYYQDKGGKPTWDNFRKTLIAQYGSPSREEVAGEGIIYHKLYWYYDPQWHTVGLDSVPKECREIDTNMPSSFPYNDVLWLPSTVHEDCPVRLSVLVSTYQTLVDYYNAIMFDEPAALRDSIAEDNQKKLEKEKALREAEQIKPTL